MKQSLSTEKGTSPLRYLYCELFEHVTFTSPFSGFLMPFIFRVAMAFSPLNFKVND
jgi:hypothetical protein